MNNNNYNCTLTEMLETCNTVERVTPTWGTARTLLLVTERSFLHNGRWHSEGDAPDRNIGCGPWCHLDAVYDGADTETEGAAGAVRGDTGKVRDRVELDGLVATVIACHVALATVDAHVLVDHRHHLLLVVKVTICANHGDGLRNHVLQQLTA